MWEGCGLECECIPARAGFNTSIKYDKQMRQDHKGEITRLNGRMHGGTSKGCVGVYMWVCGL